MRQRERERERNRKRQRERWGVRLFECEIEVKRLLERARDHKDLNVKDWK